MPKRKYYVLFQCDDWKSYASMKLIGVFNKDTLLKIIIKKVKQNEFEFGGNIQELKNMTITELENCLKYGYIQELEINEVL